MRIAVFCDVFPELSETFVVNEIRAMRRHGHDVSVVSLGYARRAHRPDDLNDLPVTFFDDLSQRRKATALAGLAARRPARLVGDVRGKERLRRPARAR